MRWSCWLKKYFKALQMPNTDAQTFLNGAHKLLDCMDDRVAHHQLQLMEKGAVFEFVENLLAQRQQQRLNEQIEHTGIEHTEVVQKRKI